MQINLITSEQKAQEQLSTLEAFKANLPSETMYFRFPQTLDIENDFASEHFHQKETELRNTWKQIESSLMNAIEKLCNEHGCKNIESIDCYLTSLGTYGYFNPPNELFVNIWDAQTEHILETIVHEVLHLILAGKVQNMSYRETEEFIDAQFQNPALASIFPKYIAQQFANS